MDLTKYEPTLKEIFKKDKFKPEQALIIYNLIELQKDVCAILPTGYGKSLCFQFVPVYTKRPAFIISPLISLMEDQKINLEKIGVTVCCLNSTHSDRRAAIKDIMDNKYQIIYLTPEYVVKSPDLLKEVHTKHKISLIAIDESHEISQWGISFRPEYKNLNVLKEWFPDVPVLALTATATKKIQADICESLNLNDPLLIVGNFDRPNIYYNVIEKRHINLDLEPYFLDAKKKVIVRPVIIYVKITKDAEKIAALLISWGVKAGFYHGKMLTSQRKKIHHDFLNNEIDCVVATVSFGLGIDRPDIKLIIHYGAPKDIESYVQEAGRAVRNGDEGESVIFFNRSDFALNRRFLQDIKDNVAKDYSMKMLKILEDYLRSKTCRRKELLKYFGQNYNEQNNRCCDNCIAPKADLVIDDISNTKTLLRCILHHNDVFGLTSNINILKGSHSSKMSDAMNKSEFFGKGMNLTLDKWKVIAQSLFTNGYVKEKPIDNTSYGNTVSVTTKGIQWLNANANK